MAMMDLLVHIAAKNRLSPAGHVIKVPSPYPGDDPIQFKPNTLIGDLGVTEIQIVPKRAPEPKVPVKKVAKFEKTVRLTVYLSKSNKFLVRVNPDKPLVELLPQICEEHGTVSTFFTLRLLHKPDEEMDLSKTLSDYKLPQNELSLVDLRGPQPVVADMPKEKKKKSIFGFKSTTKKKQKGDTDTESVKSGPTQQPPSSGLTVTQVRASPAPSPKPLRPPPPLAGAVALPIIDGSHLRKQQTAPQHQNAAPPPAPPQPPARKRPAPRPPSVTPRQSVKEPPVEIQVQPVHVDTIQKTTDNGLLENRIVIGEESHELILDNTSATPASLSSHSSLPSSPSHGPNTSNNIAPVNVPVHNESGTLKKRKAPPPPKPPQPVTKSGSPPVAAKRVPPQPPMRHQRQTSTGSTVSAGSDSSGGNRIDSSPSATPPTTIERPTRPVRRDHSPTRLKAVPPPPPVQPTVILDPSLLANKTEAHTEGVAYRKRSSKPTKPPRPLTYAGEVLVENTKSRRPCSFIAPPPPEEPPSPETVPEDIDKLIQEGRLSVAIVRDDTGADTEDSSESEKSASLSLSSGSTQSAISSSRSDEHTEDQDSTNKEKSQITEMLDHMINAEEKIKVTGSTDDIEADDDSRDDSGIVEASPPLVSPRKLKQQSTDDSEDDELTEEEARIIANLELEDDEDEEEIEKDKKSTNEGESSATESEDIALKSMMMKLSIEDISNDTTNYSPTTEHEEEFMLEEKLISQIAYKVDRHPLPDSHGIKVQRSEELVKERDITTPEPESTESQLGEEMEQKEEKEKMVPKDDVITITKNVEVEKKLDKTEIKPVEEEEIKTKDDAVPVVTTTASTTAGTAQSEGQSNQLQEQFALLQQQYAALQQQMITSQQAVLQQQQQQIASVSQLPPQATATMSAPMMMQQPAVMMQPVMTPQQQQYQQQMLMQQQMMQYMGMQQPMIVPVASTPQMMTYPQPIVQQPVMIPPQSSQQLVVGSPPRVVQQMMVGHRLMR
uniref:Cordon-bleu protein-like 1-like n=1 Tax=Saccoglossus kowalevskii TaxID=10224 RepID=A0ABM0MES8_SACKO|nr:PREDICTED: cordon-bleu protein-like 1-like [Saccoglossus kowalevskii]